MKTLNSMLISGKESLPIIEGGKGVAATNGYSSGAMAAAGGVGTFSGANSDTYDADGNFIPFEYKGKTRRERHEELVEIGIQGCIQQAEIARDICKGAHPIHINVLWEQAAAERILHGVFEKVGDLIDGITCGAGMPYKLSSIAAQYNTYYYPIVSSMRAFRALWKRAYSKTPDLLGGVVYEDPWLAGGHNGLSNSEDPLVPEAPYARVAKLRAFMNEVGLQQTPIVMAGGVWHLSDWQDWIDNPELGPIAFQFGTRPLLTQESPIPKAWKDKLLDVKNGDILLHDFSPTGFYSSAIKNELLSKLQGRKERQMNYATESEGYLTEPFATGPRGRPVYISVDDMINAKKYVAEGFDTVMKTPDSTIIFVNKQESQWIMKSQADCMGCLSHCKFSNWKDHDDFKTGKRADPRSFCIQEHLQGAIHGLPIEDHLIFAGHNAYKFAEDPLYANGFIPTVQQLVDQIKIGK